MDREIGVKGIELNSKYFSGQYRPRVYWSNIDFENVNLDKYNRNIKDYLEKKPDEKYFFDLNPNKIKKLKNSNKLKHGINKIYLIPRELLKDNERQRRVYDIRGKSPTLLARSDTPKIYINNKIRKLTPLECERLQGIPDNYTSLASDTQRYKMIGNAFTVSVIEHFLKGLEKNPVIKKRIKQETLF